MNWTFNYEAMTNRKSCVDKLRRCLTKLMSASCELQFDDVWGCQVFISIPQGDKKYWLVSFVFFLYIFCWAVVFSVLPDLTALWFISSFDWPLGRFWCVLLFKVSRQHCVCVFVCVCALETFHCHCSNHCGKRRSVNKAVFFPDNSCVEN